MTTTTTTFKFTKGERVRLLDETAVGIIGDCGVEPDENAAKPGPYYSLALESDRAGRGFMGRLGVYAEHEMVPVAMGYPTLPYGPQDVRHDGKCDHDSGCTNQAVAALISASHAECVCGGGCDRTPASLAFLCGDHAASESLGGEPRATREAALEKFRAIEGDAVREIWRWAIAWHPVAVAIPDGPLSGWEPTAEEHRAAAEAYARAEVKQFVAEKVAAGELIMVADGQCIEPEKVAGNPTVRDKLAQYTAEYVAAELNPLTERAAQIPGCSIVYPGGQKPPTDVEEIKATLLDGRLWISWMDDRVFAAMRAIHRGYDEHRAIVNELVESGEAVGFNVRQQGAESQ